MKSIQNIRNDIQVLRGYAVLLVIVYHAKIGLFKSGYLGVDIFFVISGFLITQMISARIDGGDFSIIDFYNRRARRLLPSAYVVFILTTFFASLILTKTDGKSYFYQLFGALLFGGNFVLWSQGGYFGGESAAKPLLHVWSLAIEEQYYFVLPFFLVFVHKKYWVKSIFVILIVSALVCFYSADRYSATFYMLPTRAWELLIGSLGAIIADNKFIKKTSDKIFHFAVLLVIVIPMHQLFDSHPSFDALIVCLSTAAIIISNNHSIGNARLLAPIKRSGDLSYSLYIVHWPIFAFMNNIWIGDGVYSEINLTTKLILILATFVLAFILNKYIEEPFRYNKSMSGLMAVKIFGSVGFCLLVYSYMAANVNNKSTNINKNPAYGLNKECAISSGLFESKNICRTKNNPEILVWGDSYAMHLIPGIISSNNDVALEQATMSKCSPILDYAVVAKQVGTGTNKAWAKDCMDFNRSVFNFLKGAQNIKTVVISSPFDAVVNKSAYDLMHGFYGVNNDYKYEIIDAGSDYGGLALSRTINMIRSIGKKVVIFEPPPKGGFDSRKCLERLDESLVKYGGPDDCIIDYKLDSNINGPVYDMLRNLANNDKVGVISFVDDVCNGVYCMTKNDGLFIYRDKGHLSVDGSIYLGRKMKFYERINALAK